ncbi:MAG: NAD(P)H-binding protein [Candidatus Pacebacteria bacterium]|nr:NAD(P)H-binding protein [Candidatus Paceibacterota bacterium]
MRITVFGATGHVGKLFLERALAEGHTITAYARSPQKITPHEHLTVVAGSLTEADKIDAAIQGADAVVSVMGPGGYQDTLIFAPAYRLIIASMKVRGVKRLIALGTPTVRDKADKPTLVFETLIRIVRLIINKGSEDIATVGTLVRESGLDWTLVRIPLLSQSPATGRVVTGAFGAPIWWPFITREDFVDFLMRQLTDRTYIHYAPAISN